MNISKYTKAARKALPLKYCAAVIVAAGTASRMGGIDKVMAPLGGEPMIVRTVRTFQQCDAIREIVIVTREDLLIPMMDLCHGFDKVQAVIVGGIVRQSKAGGGAGRCKTAGKRTGHRPDCPGSQQLRCGGTGDPGEGYHQNRSRRCGSGNTGQKRSAGGADTSGI